MAATHYSRATLTCVRCGNTLPILDCYLNGENNGQAIEFAHYCPKCGGMKYTVSGDGQ